MHFWACKGSVGMDVAKPRCQTVIFVSTLYSCGQKFRYICHVQLKKTGAFNH